jgi:hypothetical protein
MKRIMMIFCLVGFIAGTLPLVSCLTGMQQSDKGYKITYSSSMGSVRTSAAFSGYVELKASEDKRAKAELRSPDYSAIPTVGYLFIYLKGGDIEDANPAKALYILKDATGRELYRGNGRNEIPDYDGTSVINGTAYSTWSAMDSLRLDDPSVRFPLTLRVVRMLNEVQDITITKATPTN